MRSTSARYALLDELRGLDLISMMLYHGMWDLVYLFGVRAPWYGSWQGELWQQSICWVFILLSGFCLPLGRHPVKRGAVVFGCGALVTAVTLVFMPADVVWFGVLTLLGSAMIITGLLEKWMEKVPPVVGLAGSMFLFYFTRYAADGYLQLGHWLITLPGFLYANYFTAYLGFYPFGFFSTDYGKNLLQNFSERSSAPAQQQEHHRQRKQQHDKESHLVVCLAERSVGLEQADTVDAPDKRAEAARIAHRDKIGQQGGAGQHAENDLKAQQYILPRPSGSAVCRVRFGP